MVFGPKGHDTLKLDYATASVPRPVVRSPNQGVSSYVSCPTVRFCAFLMCLACRAPCIPLIRFMGVSAERLPPLGQGGGGEVHSHKPYNLILRGATCGHNHRKQGIRLTQ